MNRFQIILTGRKVQNSGSTVFSPWEDGMLKSSEELWYIFQGDGKVRHKNGEWKPIRNGMLVWFRPNTFYEIEQNSQNPIGINFFHFTRPPESVWSDDVTEIIETTDPSFADSISRRIIELYWEEYFEKIVVSGADLKTRGIPRPRFVNESELVRTDSFLPQTMSLEVPRKQETDSLIHAADLFRNLLAEYKYLAGRNISLTDAGIQRHHRATISAMVAQINSDLKNAPSIPDMAAQCGYSLDHFGRIFRKIMGCSPQDFMIRIRTARARQLLVETGMSIKEIAVEVGYRSPYFFSRQFKSVVGEPPTDFRKRFTKEYEG